MEQNCDKNEERTRAKFRLSFMLFINVIQTFVCVKLFQDPADIRKRCAIIHVFEVDILWTYQLER